MAKKTPQRKKAKQRPRAPKRATPDPLRALSDDQRVSIYYRLIGDPVLRRRAQEIAEELLHDVTVEEVARQVSREVAGADIDEVYAHSGATAFGYVDPYEYACEYLDGLVKPFLDDLRVRVDQGRVEEAKTICMGNRHGPGARPALPRGSSGRCARRPTRQAPWSAGEGAEGTSRHFAPGGLLEACPGVEELEAVLTPRPLPPARWRPCARSATLVA